MGQMYFPGENGTNSDQNGDWKYGCGFIAIIVLVILYFCGVFDDNDSVTSSDDTNKVSVNTYNNYDVSAEETSYLSVIPSSITVESDGGSYSFRVKSSHSWRISTDTYDWGHIERNGDQLTLRVDENKSQESRTDYFEVSTGDITFRVNIDQKGSSIPYLNVSPTSINFPSYGGESTLIIDTNTDWYISIDTKSWGHLTKVGNKIILNIDDNPSRQERDDYFTITAGNLEETVYITQKGIEEISESNEYAKFQEIWVDHNVNLNGNKGMIIHVKFDIYGMLNKTGQCAAYFYYSNGNPLKDNNQSFRTSTGNVATHVNFTPNYDGCTFNDLTIFMPYSELHLNNNASCYFTISLWNDNTEVAKSEKNEFNISFD